MCSRLYLSQIVDWSDCIKASIPTYLMWLDSKDYDTFKKASGEAFHFSVILWNTSWLTVYIYLCQVYLRFFKTRQRPFSNASNKKEQVTESLFSQALVVIIIKAGTILTFCFQRWLSGWGGEMKHCECFEVFSVLVPVRWSRPSVLVGTAFDKWRRKKKSNGWKGDDENVFWNM